MSNGDLTLSVPVDPDFLNLDESHIVEVPTKEDDAEILAKYTKLRGARELGVGDDQGAPTVWEVLESALPEGWHSCKQGCPFGGPSAKGHGVSILIHPGRSKLTVSCSDPSHGHDDQRGKAGKDGKVRWSWTYSVDQREAHNLFPALKRGDAVELADEALHLLRAGSKLGVDGAGNLRRYDDSGKLVWKNRKQVLSEMTKTAGTWVVILEDQAKEVIANFARTRRVAGASGKTRPLSLSQSAIDQAYDRMVQMVRREWLVDADLGKTRFEVASPVLVGMRKSAVWVEGGKLVRGQASSDLCVKAEHMVAVDLSEDACREDARAMAPRWLSFLASLWDGEEDILARMDFLHEWIGACLLGRVHLHQRHFLAVGTASGANGKSTLGEVIAAVLPPTMTSAVRPEVMTGFGGTKLISSRFNRILEASASKGVTDVSALKSITSGDWVQIDRKYRDAVTVQVTAGQYMAVNASFVPSDTTESFFRRWVAVTFPNRFGNDPGLINDLVAESAAIIRISIAAYGAMLQRGGRYTVLPSSGEAIAKWRGDVDSAVGWAQDRITITDDSTTRLSACYQDYQDWCRRKGLKNVKSEKGFAASLKEVCEVKDFRKAKVGGASVRVVPCRLHPAELPSGSATDDDLEGLTD